MEFAEWTRAGSLRQPSYLGLRDDKDASGVVREDPKPGPPAEHAAARDAKRAGTRTARSSGKRARAIVPPGKSAAVLEVGGRELKLSNLEKVLYPETGFTKREVIDYYAAVAPPCCPHLAGRALTVTRWPDGVEAKSFFQKQSPAHRPEWVRTASLPAEGKTIDYTLADDEPTLVWLANLAAIELHTPLARAAAHERPTSMVFDLDPGAPAT